MQKIVRRTLKAIGLLELMLSLAIIAVALILATRYYSSASQSQKIQTAVDMINALRGGFLNYIAGQPGGQQNVTIGELVQAGYVPATFVSSNGNSSEVNPWGMRISLNSQPNQATFQINLVTPNFRTCQQVKERVTSLQLGALAEQTQCYARVLKATFYK